jgi:cytoskeleton protein RodZ
MPQIGETLREARMRAKIDISEVEAETKIRAKYLRALENEDWALMPGGTFVRSFLRTYAEYLGLDAKMLVEEYKLRHQALSELDMAPISPPGAQSRQLQPPRISRGWVVGLSVAGLLVLLIVLGSIGSSGRNDKAGVASQRTSTVKPAPAPAVAPPVPTTVRLQLIPLDEVYVCLVDARGRRLIDGQILGPDKTPTYTGRRFQLLFGHGPEQMKVNGRRQSVPASSDPIGYEVAPSGRRVLSRARLPNCTQ